MSDRKIQALKMIEEALEASDLFSIKESEGEHSQEHVANSIKQMRDNSVKSMRKNAEYVDSLDEFAPDDEQLYGALNVPHTPLKHYDVKVGSKTYSGYGIKHRSFSDYARLFNASVDSYDTTDPLHDGTKSGFFGQVEDIHREITRSNKKSPSEVTGTLKNAITLYSNDGTHTFFHFHHTPSNREFVHHIHATIHEHDHDHDMGDYYDEEDLPKDPDRFVHLPYADHRIIEARGTLNMDGGKGRGGWMDMENLRSMIRDGMNPPPRGFLRR